MHKYTGSEYCLNIGTASCRSPPPFPLQRCPLAIISCQRYQPEEFTGAKGAQKEDLSLFRTPISPRFGILRDAEGYVTLTLTLTLTLITLTLTLITRAVTVNLTLRFRTLKVLQHYVTWVPPPPRSCPSQTLPPTPPPPANNYFSGGGGLRHNQGVALPYPLPTATRSPAAPYPRGNWAGG